MDGPHLPVLDQLPDQTWIYPGHGDDATIGRERPSLPQWKGLRLVS